jgi:hypothetical protein
MKKLITLIKTKVSLAALVGLYLLNNNLLFNAVSLYADVPRKSQTARNSNTYGGNTPEHIHAVNSMSKKHEILEAHTASVLPEGGLK